MKIAACVKRVPDTATKIRIGPGQRGIDPSEVQYIMSPYDEFAVEEAIRIKERAGAGEVVVICLGPEAAQQVLRGALATGADAGIHLRHDGSELDPVQTARALADALRPGSFDVVMFGRLAVDGQSAQVGPMTARLLGIPCVTEVVKLEIDGRIALADREVEGSRERVEVGLPAAFTAQKGLNEPRYASLKGIMAAKKKPIEVRAPALAEPCFETVALSLPPPRPVGRIVGEGVDAIPELVRLLREEAKAI